MKICSTCKQQKSFDQFNKKTANKDGLERYCKECHRRRNRRHYAANKSTYMASALKFSKNRSLAINTLKQKCTQCEESRSWCLDFHHLDPTEKDANISTMVRKGLSFHRISEEIDKCVVLCKNCHADMHHKMRHEKGIV